MDDEDDFPRPGPAHLRRGRGGRIQNHHWNLQHPANEGAVPWRNAAFQQQGAQRGGRRLGPPHGDQQAWRRNDGFQVQDGGDRPRQNPGYENNNRQDGNMRGNARTHNRNEQPNRNGNQQQNRNQRFLGFRGLQEIAQCDSQEIIANINQKKDSFSTLIDSPIDSDKSDYYVLIMQIISKVCESSFDEMKLKFLLEVCNSRFIGFLRIYLMDLPHMETRARAMNRLYWNNPNDFWTNFITFCKCIINVSPSTALHKCRSLIDETSKMCLEGLKTRHEFTLSDEYNETIVQLRERLNVCEEEDKVKKEKSNRPKGFVAEGQPPESFRELSVLPTSDDLLISWPFVRPNIVDGGYDDVEHYLDVQFRLLREDCFGPLRDGIIQYKQDPKRKKFDNIRIYHNVKFCEPYITKTKVGATVQLDEKTTKRLKKINWAHSKRFIFGSLLLFTKDNCKSFITATILDREPKLLYQGKIPVSIVDIMVGDNIYNVNSYVMIESEVYFEPYLHVLKALKDPKFPEHLAMSKYIVKVDTIPKPPAYLSPDATFAVQTDYSPRTKFKVLQDITWPTKEDLGLNESQYEAYKLALTHEFAVIQGPPGTGKTFLGVRVAKTLLENLNPPAGACLMLVICYTNHALDQFLEAIMPVTKSIVRIGGQSRNEAMEKINLATLRTNCKTKIDNMTNKLFYQKKDNLRSSVCRLQHAQDHIDSVDNGIISYDSLKGYIPEVQVLGEFYANHRANIKSDPIEHWLFENMNYVPFDNILIEENEENFEVINVVNDIDDINERIEVVLDNFDYDSDEEIYLHRDQQIKVKVTFSVKEVKSKLKTLISFYKKTENTQQIQLLRRQIVGFKSRINLFNEMSENRNSAIQINIARVNVATLPVIDRWSLYFKWANVVIDDMKTYLRPLQNSMESANTAYEEARMMIDLKIVKGIKVVGMTTSGAARLRKLLQALAPPIVIVEEAAEVLEQHIVTSLTKDCEHLLLIGDHQQLRPSAAHMKLARHYNLEVSLFERMITNGVHSRRLRVQHRMRPELAALIAPHIYADLQNHPSVEHFPNVRGITDNLFFLTHNYMEDEVDDSASRSNHKEADMVLRLANYLMQQDYAPEDVTVLAAYSGQMFYMRKQRETYAYLKKIKITVVDNYQGEESKIILLSLVRNNAINKIGFLGTENRICVALSRAREGFYIFGNIDILKRNSTLWKNIATTLENNASLGSALMLKCESHQSQITTISSPKDFEKVPEGGCLLKCNFNLKCGHRCPLICHGYDRNHENTKCYMKCERTDFCEVGHPCPLICAVKCQPCKRLVDKVLPCSHQMSLYCHKDPNDPTVKCLTMVGVTLPNCKHEAKKPCYMETAAVRCPVRCVLRVRCGHECRLRCHVADDPDHERYLCDKPCAKAKKCCSVAADKPVEDRRDHQCQKRCHEECDLCTVEVSKKRSTCKHSERVACHNNVDSTPCNKKCARMLECGHFCKKKCYEPCGDCKQKVKKIIPECQHEVEVMCMVEATRGLCTQECARLLPCGHRCAGLCSRPCDPTSCTELIPNTFLSPCGHGVQLPCNMYNLRISGGQIKSEQLMEHCSAPCGVQLACEHACAGTCATCRQGRLHAACKQTCQQTNICGHQCKEPCNQVCPPCKMRCEIRCPHTRCNQQCGAPCVPCQEKCARACPHGACSRRCGEPCSRAPCDERCPKIIPCGHPCRGLCGEPCPDICKICRPDDFPKDFLGDDFDDDEKFVQLQDCPHVLDVDNIDSLMTGDREAIAIRSCPFCRKPIINTYRYKDVVNEMFRSEINPIKERVYGTAEQIMIKRKELIHEIITFAKGQDDEVEEQKRILEENPYWKKAFDQLRKIAMSQKKVSVLKLEMQFQYLNILDMIGECYLKFKTKNLTELKEELDNLIKLICCVLIDNTQKISQQLQMDIGNEIKRINSVVQLSEILSHDSYKSSKTAPKVKDAAVAAKNAVLTWREYNKLEGVKALGQLQEAVKVFGIVSKQERDLIVQAIGSKAGSWYKCPNGHFYSISHCGGAMEKSKCADCGAAIGGENHALLGDNAHAGEVDGSNRAAWGNHDNIADFNF